MTNEAAAARAAAATMRTPRCTFPTGPSRRANRMDTRRTTSTEPHGDAKEGNVLGRSAFPEAKYHATLRKSTRVLLDRHPVVHLVHAQNLGFAAVAAELVVLAHD